MRDGKPRSLHVSRKAKKDERRGRWRGWVDRAPSHPPPNVPFRPLVGRRTNDDIFPSLYFLFRLFSFLFLSSTRRCFVYYSTWILVFIFCRLFLLSCTLFSQRRVEPNRGVILCRRQQPLCATYLFSTSSATPNEGRRTSRR